MKAIRNRSVVFFSIITMLAFIYANPPSHAAEPLMADYQYFPLFLPGDITPNILIMLDNSGSMNNNAYGAYPGDSGIVNDAFLGAPYHTFRTLDVSISDALDDVEERRVDGYTYNSGGNDLDLGRDPGGGLHDDMISGLRFQNVEIPPGATILRSYIEFTTQSVYPAQMDLTLTISAEDSDNAPAFEMTASNISGRTQTTETVNWNLLLAEPWDTVGETHQTPELKAVVQAVVNRGGWTENNAMVFVLQNPVVGDPGTGRTASQYEAGTDRAALLHVEYAVPSPTEPKLYYGYFNPNYFYRWDSNEFVHAYKKVGFTINASGTTWDVEDLGGVGGTLTSATIVGEGLWDGNWMNWLCMRRIDVLRKVLMGGLATSRTGGGNQVNIGETPDQSWRKFIRVFDSSQLSAVSPYHGRYYYGMTSGYVQVNDNSDVLDSNYLERLTIRIQKDINLEPEDFYNYDSGDNLAGVFQRFMDKARWGNEWFNTGTGNNQSGGTISNTIGTNTMTMITDFQNTGADTWTPLGEAYYVAMQYFKQEDPSGTDFTSTMVPNDNVGQDPYYNGTEFVYCAKSFVLLLTDGASTMDANVPAEFKDTDGDGDNTACDESTGTNCDYPSGGTDFLDDVALYAHTNDLRADLFDDQFLTLFTVYAMGDDDNARDLLKDAARNGGFKDRNGNGVPDGDYDDPDDERLEWDKDGDNIPDTYFEASDGYELEVQLGKAITAILQEAASGTAVSVISTAGEGEGNLVQAYFKPSMPIEGGDDVTWVGYLKSLWVDSHGNLREDTNLNSKLDIEDDYIIEYTDAGGATNINKFVPGSVDPEDFYSYDPDLPDDTVPLEGISPVWEAGTLLSRRDPDTRKIFTFIDKDNDGVVDDAGNDSFDGGGELVRFQTDVADDIKPYLGVVDDVTWVDLGDTQDNRVSNIIRFIRGYDDGFAGSTAMRQRNISDVNGEVWKLGDIVYSTPVQVAAPAENFDLLYGDESYFDFYQTHKDRETIIYVGANDGMLHAFTSWQYDKAIQGFVRPAASPGAEQIGDELWAFIPQSLLPHLKWLPSINYTHVGYVDSQPRIFDAKIDVDGNGTAEWRTLLLTGLKYGGRHIWAQGDYDNDSILETRHFYPSYMCMDITDPRNPRLLWERTYSVPAAPGENADNNTDLGLATSFPTVAKVNEKWFAIFGSGPADFEGISNGNGHIFIVDLTDGTPYQNAGNDWWDETAETWAFMGSPTSIDKMLNYSVDAIYIGETYDAKPGHVPIEWAGAVYKVTVPWNGDVDNYGIEGHGSYDDNPNSWTLSKLFDSPAPITAAPALSVDFYENTWVFFGTGRYLSETDLYNVDDQFIYGIKDPFFNREHGTDPTDFFGDNFYLNNGGALTLTNNDLLNADGFIVIEGGEEVFGGATNDDFAGLKTDAGEKDGWFRTLQGGERSVAKPVAVGGVVLTTTFIPNNDICEYGGDSRLFGLYYETGTANKNPVFSDGTIGISVGGETKEQVKDVIDIGVGKGSTSAVHIGKEDNDEISVYIQKSTGTVEKIRVKPPLKIRSGLKSWQEQ